MIKNKQVSIWIESLSKLLNPDNVVLIDGSNEQLEELRRIACNNGELTKLNEDKLPGCYLHRTEINDVARVEDRTLYSY